MSEQVKVFSAPGRKVPREENPRKYYPENQEEAALVARTPYIERMLLTGDLVMVPATPGPVSLADAAAAQAESAPSATAVAAKPAGKKKE